MEIQDLDIIEAMRLIPPIPENRIFYIVQFIVLAVCLAGAIVTTWIVRKRHYRKGLIFKFSFETKYIIKWQNIDLPRVLFIFWSSSFICLS